MPQSAHRDEPRVTRRVFGSWSIEVPISFDETFVRPDGYWHAYAKDRSVSLTSIEITDDRGPVGSERLLEQLPALDGDVVEDVPAGISGRVATTTAPGSARASQMLCGLLAIDGRLLIATITSDDLEWAREIWLSIRAHPTAPRRGDRRAAGILHDTSRHHAR